MERSSRSSGKRRSSILKLGFNRDDETNTTGFIFNKSQGQSRRVSFAATAEVKEFPRDSPRVWRSDSEEDNEKENVPQQNKAGGVSITGLDSLIHGQIDPQSYQGIIDCPIPEMSADSFNLSIGNKTVRDTIDMETTQCVEPSEFDWGAFQTEPSAEIRMAESSFLASLKRQTQCMSPLQIYRSPNNRQQNSQTLTSYGPYDPDNEDDESPIMMTLQFNETMAKSTDSPQYKPVDSKSFLSGLFSSNSLKRLNNLNDDDMDVSLCNERIPQSHRTVYFTENDRLNGMDETHCHGAILNNSQTDQSMRSRSNSDLDNQTKQGNSGNGNISQQYRPVDSKSFFSGLFSSNSLKGFSNLNNDCMNESLYNERIPQSHRTVYFTQNDSLNGMDETHCHGAILNNSQLDQSLKTRTDGDIDGEKQVNSGPGNGNKTHHGDCFQGLEETACIGGILSNTDKENMVPKSLNSTQLSLFSGHERTKYFGENAPVEMMEETQSIGAILKRDLTIQMTSNNTIMNMKETERTKYFGDQEDCMEETKCVESNSQETNIKMSDKSPQKGLDRTNCSSSNNVENYVDDTAAVEGILKNNPITSHYLGNNEEHALNDERDNNKTKYFTENNKSFAIDETMCEGGILHHANNSEKLNRSQQRRSISSQGDKTKYFTDMTVNIEETKCLGGDIDIETNQTRDVIEKDQNKTIHFGKLSEQAGIEETHCIDATIHIGITTTKGKEDGIARQNDLKENEADPNKTEHCGAQSELAELEETHCENASVHRCNTTSRQEKVGHKTVEHDKDILDLSHKSSDKHDENIDKVLNMDETIEQPFHKTVIANVSMEETNIGCGIVSDISMIKEPMLNPRYDVETGRESVNDKSYRQNSPKGEGINVDMIEEDSDSIVLKSFICENTENRVLTKDKSSVKSTSISNCSSSEKEDMGIDSPSEQVCPDVTDSEITSKATNKRTLSDLRSKDLEPERTRDLTQTDSYTKKIKGMLMMSAQKTAPQIKAGMIKTPSKSMTGMNTDESETTGTNSATASPAHKRIRLFESGAKPVAGIMDTDMELGIDEETMPDGMSHIVNDICNETVSQHNTTRGTSESGTTSTQSLSNTSLFSNRSLLSKAPDGPMTLDTFFKLTAKPPSGYDIDVRCSVYMPKRSIEFLDEKLETEIVDRYLVEEKKKMYERVTDKLQKNEENLDWLKKTIEETQPQIFQDVAKGNIDEVNAISEELFSMYNCCLKEGSIIWKQERKKMFEETMERIETEGVQKAESLLETVRKQNKETDELLTNIDQEIEDLERSQSLILELEERKKQLEKLAQENKEEDKSPHLIYRELKEACRNLERDSLLEKELKKKVEDNQQNRKLQELRAALRLQISQQLFLVGWNLEDFNEDWIGFTFLDEEFLLTVYLKKDASMSKIQGIEMESRLEQDCPWLHKKIAHSLLLKAVDKQYLLQKYKDYSSLPKMLNEISSIAFEINRICKEVEAINCKHKLSWDGQMLSMELWNSETLKMVKLSVDLLSQLTRKSGGSDLNVLVKTQLGNVSSEEIHNTLTSVTPGSKYLHRIIQSVELKLSEMMIND